MSREEHFRHMSRYHIQLSKQIVLSAVNLFCQSLGYFGLCSSYCLLVAQRPCNMLVYNNNNNNNYNNNNERISRALFHVKHAQLR